MRFAFQALSYVCVTLAISGIAQAKEWHGIVPFHSTREDVERLLGPPPIPPVDGYRVYKPSKARSIYFTDEGEVYIVFEEKEAVGGPPCKGTIPAGTVLLIQVTPKKELQLSDLNLDERNLRRFDPTEPPNTNSEYEGYVDEEEGISVRTSRGKVQVINYYATAKDRRLCPTYSGGSKWFCSILIH
jgi:hypothetical protein